MALRGPFGNQDCGYELGERIYSFGNKPVAYTLPGMGYHIICMDGCHRFGGNLCLHLHL
jgi:hypothetical protein